jgi:hypothetical protein
MFQKKLLFSGGGILALGILSPALIWLNGYPSPATPASSIPTASAPAHPVARITSEDLESLSWSNLARATRDLGNGPVARESVTLRTEPFENAPTRYLQALFLLAENNPDAALTAFDTIEMEQIPPLYLYAPYRLHGARRAVSPNPYLPSLEEAIRQGEVPALIRARVEAREGRLEEALLSYTRSNPSTWVRHDLSTLSAIHRHAGLRPDADLLIQGALRAGRVPENIRPSLLSIVKGNASDKESETQRIETLRRRMESNPNLREFATTATLRQLSARKQFMEKRYDELLELHGLADPKSVTDETALLLLLSAARAPDSRALDRWSQEIRRRFPSTEVKDWIESLRTATS